VLPADSELTPLQREEEAYKAGFLSPILPPHLGQSNRMLVPMKVKVGRIVARDREAGMLAELESTVTIWGLANLAKTALGSEHVRAWKHPHTYLFSVRAEEERSNDHPDDKV
jgi:hypothetical protein